MSRQWQVKKNGKVFGPYDDDQVRELAAKGQINSKTPIRSDSKSIWIAAGKIPGLLLAKDPGTEQLDDVEYVDDAWYVGQNGKRLGPFTLEELRQKADSGWLKPTDLLWKPGRENWEPVSAFPQIAVRENPPPLPNYVRSTKENSQRSATSISFATVLGFLMFGTVLLWPFLSIAMTTFRYQQDLAEERLIKAPGGFVVDIQGGGYGGVMTESQAYVARLIPNSIIALIGLGFVFALEALLLFAIKGVRPRQGN